MNKKRAITYILICIFTAGLLSSCAIDKKCPAYTQVKTTGTDFPS